MEEILQRICKAWNLKEPRPFIKFAIERISELWNDKNVFVVEAPTGYGKSLISAVIAVYSVEKELKAIICYPLRTLIEDQYNTFTGRKEGKKAIYDEKLIGIRYMHHPDSRYLIKPITLTTVDTFSLTLFGIAPEDFEKALKAYEGISFSFGHYMFSWASVILSNVVLDEVHLLADSTKSLNFLLALINIAIRFNQKLILMSATLPEVFKDIIAELGSDKIEFLTFSGDDDFVKERMSKSYELELIGLKEDEKLDNILEIIKKSKFRRVLVVFNTVNDAINFYKLATEDKEILKNFDIILLIHSRFTELDRAKKVDKLKNLKNNYLVISTQVIEAGVDMSSDLLITEIAPANSLIQRFGRFLRYDEKVGKAVVWYEMDENGDLKLRISLNKKPKNWVCVDVKDDRVFDKCVEILKERFNVNVKKLNEWKGKKDYLAIAVPMYKVYNYELTLKTLEWLKENKGKLNAHIPKGNGAIKGYKDLLDYVYTKDFFKFDENMVRELQNIHDHLEDPEKAVELLIKYEGSFVRDSYQVSVIPEKFLDEFVGKNERDLIKLVRKYCIPISAENLTSLDVVGVLFRDEDGTIKFAELKNKELLDPKILLRGIKINNNRYVNPIAFVVKAEYDEEVGMVFKDDLRI